MSPLPLVVPNQAAYSPPVTLDPTQTTVSVVNGADVDAGFQGTVYSIVTTAVSNGTPASAVAVSFSVIFPYASSGTPGPVAMPATMMTDANGHSTTTVAVGAGIGQVVVELSGGASVLDCDVPAATDAGLPCALASPPDAGGPPLSDAGSDAATDSGSDAGQ